MIPELISSGLALIPIPQGQKSPVHEGWNLPSQCVTSVDGLDIFQRKNIGLAHAYCTPSPTCAIDIDNYKAAKSWLESHGIDLNALLFSSDAVVIWSGKRFSLKLLYRLPIGVNPLTSKIINGADGRVALEFRCATKDGRTTQDLLPPSIHPSGNQYQWVGKGDPLKLPTLPTSLMVLWQKLANNGSRVEDRKFIPDLRNHPCNESPRQIAIIKDALSHITANCSYEVWRNIVWSILSTHWSCAESIAKTWSLTAPDRYNEDAFWTLVNSYIPNRQSKITVGTIFYHARLGGWRG